MIKIRIHILVLCLSSLFISCGTDDYAPDEKFDFSTKIIGKWEQVSMFNLKDSTIVPNAYEWVDVENGFTLEFFDEERFEYAKFQDCFAGTYFLELDSDNIEFYFDCEINFNGEITSNLKEDFYSNDYNNEFLNINHYLGAGCVEECSSLLTRLY